ncbi:MAG TPA: DUF420 domain-containing protein [Phycisphaeraceae bacterium]
MMAELDLSFLPAVNAALNAIAAGLLVTGYAMIRRGRVAAHRKAMISAFGVSMLFLVLYVTHKAWRAAAGGELHTTFHAEGWLKAAYLFILLTHLTLAMVVPVLAVALIWLGWTGRLTWHRRLARVGLPAWLYVSATGVAIYFLLYHFNPPAG